MFYTQNYAIKFPAQASKETSDCLVVMLVKTRKILLFRQKRILSCPRRVQSNLYPWFSRWEKKKGDTDL